jgi:hypothetical protein
VEHRQWGHVLSEMLSNMWWEQQVAVDDARVDQADSLKGVQVGGVFVCCPAALIASVEICTTTQAMHTC